MECRQDESNVQNAVWDDGAELYEVFDSILGLGHRLDYETTPEILYLCERAVSDVDAANKVVKNKYKRMRPYVTFKEESLTPENDAKKAGPSVIHQATPAEVICTHWCFVRLPERTNEILVRAEKYAQNRVVCGHHWKSDIDASLLLAAGMFANVVRTEAFQEQLKKARAEYLAIIGGSTDVTPETNAEPRTAAVYP